MFDSPWLSHDELITGARERAATLVASELGNAFVASLSSRDPAARSALASFAFARTLPAHEWTGDRSCHVCGEWTLEGPRDLNVLSFERHKWGGVRHCSPEYVWFDLERFADEKELVPSSEDWSRMRDLLAIVERMPQGAKPAALMREWKAAFASNESERRAVLEILCIAGVTPVPERPSFREVFVQPDEREMPNVHKIDWGYPTAWWRGGSGVSKAAIVEYFPTLA